MTSLRKKNASGATLLLAFILAQLAFFNGLLASALTWAFLGHLVLCFALINRMHATRLSIRVGKLVWLSVFVIGPTVPVFFAYWFWVRAEHSGTALAFSSLPPAGVPYLATCWLAAAAATIHWLHRQATGSPPSSLLSDRRRVFRLLRDPRSLAAEDHKHHFLVRLPGNQTLDLDVSERGLDLHGLPLGLDRLTILHLSDLHFSGRVAMAYFQEVVRVCNDLKPDLIAVTGDLLDNSDCLAWIPDTLGRLRSQYGCYFVLGNHDVEIGPITLRAALEEAGLIDLGGRWLEVTVGDEKILLAGNELPWLPPAADFEHAPAPAKDGGPFRIALTHSPDQLPWAQRNDVDLLLAGHLHGGQIRFPMMGPIVSPSRHGVRYASGVFQAHPTVMHVSRGVSGEIPLRLNCRPEVAQLMLRANSLQDCPPASTA